jgi:type IV pilus assembly protein PilC
MPIYIYNAVNEQGIEVEGRIDAKNKKTAKEALEERKFSIKKLVQEKEFTLKEVFDRNNKPVKAVDILLFTKHLAVLLKAGIPVVKCFTILETQAKNIRLKKRLSKIRQDIESGTAIYDAFSKYPQHFSSMYISLIKVGEESGLLYDMVDRIFLLLKKQRALQSKVKGAMIYPAAIMLVGGSILIFLMYFIIPKFADMFNKMGSKLPTPTQIMLDISQFTQKNILNIIGGTIFGIIFLLKFGKTKIGKKVYDKLAYTVPVVKTLAIKYSVNTFTQNFAILLRSGLALTKALALTLDSVSNNIFKNELEQINKAIINGIGIGDAFSSSKVIPEMAIHMISIGDETGALEQMLENISDFYEEEVEEAIEAILGLIEPAFIVVLGIGVGAIVISMFLPILSMSKAVKG